MRIMFSQPKVVSIVIKRSFDIAYPTLDLGSNLLRVGYQVYLRNKQLHSKFRIWDVMASLLMFVTGRFQARSQGGPGGQGPLDL